jgi:hypothetical protein
MMATATTCRVAAEEPTLDRSGSTAEHASLNRWGAFSIWALVGAVSSLFLLTLGVLALAPVAIGVWLTATRPVLRRSWFGFLFGVGALALWIAYSQRHGPGLVCWHTATASGCDQYTNPLPWLVAGLVLVVVSVLAQTRRTRSQS